MSRWGPPKSHDRSSVSPIPTSGSSSTPVVPAALADDEGDRGFQMIDAVEWANPEHAFTEDGDELALKPRTDRSDDPCGCRRPDDPNALACNDLSCVLFACQEECRSSCMAGDQCGNKRIQRREWKQLEVFDAELSCRGTLEVPRSMEEEALERQLSTHWTKPLIQRARGEIVNR